MAMDTGFIIKNAEFVTRVGPGQNYPAALPLEIAVVGKSNVGKGGIVKSDKIRLMAVEKVTEYAKSIGFTLVKYVQSDVQGSDGNIEYLAHFKKSKKLENY